MILQTKKEEKHLVKLLKDSWDVAGDCAEVGVFEGESALLLQKNMAKDKKLYLFDTFEGIVDASEKDNEGTWNGVLPVPVEKVIAMFADKPNTIVVKGYFPNSVGDTMNDRQFSFVHLDVDTYNSTWNCLKFFYDKMATGGVIVTHDYEHPKLKVGDCFDTFFKGKPEKVMKLDTSQAYIIKL